MNVIPSEKEWDDLMAKVNRIEELELRVAALEEVTTPEPDPDPEPNPDPEPEPNPLPTTLSVGPGMGADFASLEEIDSNALQEGTIIEVEYQSEPYKTKIGISKSGIQLIGKPGPNGERPILSGEGARTHPSFPWPYEPIQSISMICIGRPGMNPDFPITVKGFELQDLYETNTYLDKNGVQLPYTGGAAAIRITAGAVNIEDCLFHHCIHGFFTKGQEGKVFLNVTDCEIRECGDDDGIADEQSYVESNESRFKRVIWHNPRNPGTQPLHCRSNLTYIDQCWLEGGALNILLNSCEKNYLLDASGKMPDGKLFVNDSILISYSRTESVGVRTETNWNQAKTYVKFSNSVMVKVIDMAWKAFYCLNQAGSLGTTEYENMRFLSMSLTPTAGPTGVFWELGRGVNVNFLGQSHAYLQAPLDIIAPNYGTADDLATNFQPANWKELVTNHPDMTYDQCLAKLEEWKSEYRTKLSV